MSSRHEDYIHNIKTFAGAVGMIDTEELLDIHETIVSAMHHREDVVDVATRIAQRSNNTANLLLMSTCVVIETEFERRSALLDN